jgi:hypothetical protein
MPPGARTPRQRGHGRQRSRARRQPGRTPLGRQTSEARTQPDRTPLGRQTSEARTQPDQTPLPSSTLPARRTPRDRWANADLLPPVRQAQAPLPGDGRPRGPALPSDCPSPAASSWHDGGWHNRSGQGGARRGHVRGCGACATALGEGRGLTPSWIAGMSHPKLDLRKLRPPGPATGHGSPDGL